MDSTDKIYLKDQNQFDCREKFEKSRRLSKTRNFSDTQGKANYCYRNSREKMHFNFKISHRKIEQIDESTPNTIRNYFIQEGLANGNANIIKG